jgi:peptidoglycan/xylan/chitin deacetylase (PgdA/CDA1 family)
MSDPVYRISTAENVVYLTFDDGPYIEADVPARATATTATLLDRLSELRNVVGDPDLSATFFINGWTFVKPEPIQSAPEEPDHPFAVARRAVGQAILAEGHDLANHSQHHRNPWGLPGGTPDVEQMKEEIRLTQAALERISIPTEPAAGAPAVGEIRPYFRSPGDPSYHLGQHPARPLWQNSGAPLEDRQRFQKILDAVQQMGLRYVSYDIWGKDDHDDHAPSDVYWHVIDVSYWNSLNPSTHHDADLLSFEDLAEFPPYTRDGAIILMHNGRQSSVSALGYTDGIMGIVPYLYSQGFRVRRLPALEAP